jgi:16S rRNA (cytosine1402-N4)-methyltransferase
MYHLPVMLKESIEGLDIKPNGIYADVTFGGGGHSGAILERLTTGRLIAFDQDLDALANQFNDERFTLVNHNFRFLKNFLKYYNALPLDGLIADLGVSSHQFDDSERGFSMRFSEKLDMRMNRNQKFSAVNVLNSYSFEQLKNILRSYGELENAASVSRAIEKYRIGKTITGFDHLSEAISYLAPRGKENRFYAKVLQAIRIEINGELDALKEMLVQAAEVLNPGGRLVVISYHSLEDRIAKNFIRAGNFDGKPQKDFFGNDDRIFQAVNKKPLTPSEQEVAQNSRARSAKLRIASKLKPVKS